VTRDRGSIDAAPAPALLSDTDIHQASGFVAGGENFNRLRWRLAADHAETRVSNGGGATPGAGGSATSLRRQSASAQPSYVVTRWLSLLGTLGYDHIESSGFRKDLDGSFWNGGVRLTPSQRTSFELTYGERYGGPNWASSLTAATEAEGFVLYYQPLVALRSGKVRGAEALIRWPHRKHGSACWWRLSVKPRHRQRRRPL
jgi:hypothetical protein